MSGTHLLTAKSEWLKAETASIAAAHPSRIAAILLSNESSPTPTTTKPCITIHSRANSFANRNRRNRRKPTLMDLTENRELPAFSGSW